MPTKTNSNMKLFHEKLRLRVTKETAGSQKKKNGEVPTLKLKETGDCVKCKRFCRSGDHPSSDRFVSLDTRSKFIAMGRRLKFWVVRSYSQKLVSLRASQPPLRTGRKKLKIRTVGGLKYVNQMGALGIRAAAAKSCPVSRPVAILRKGL